MMRSWFWVIILCVLPIRTQAFDFQSFKNSRKVVVHTDRAELCFTDTQDCHPVLLGKTTPTGKFDLLR